MWKDGEDAGGICLMGCLQYPFCLLFLVVSGYSSEQLSTHSHQTHTHTNAHTGKHKHTHLVYLRLLEINRCRPSCQHRHALHNLLIPVTSAVYQRHASAWLSLQWSVWVTWWQTKFSSHADQYPKSRQQKISAEPVSIVACFQPPSLPQDPDSERQEVTQSLSGCWLEICLLWVNLHCSISPLNSTIWGHHSPQKEFHLQA